MASITPSGINTLGQEMLAHALGTRLGALVGDAVARGIDS